MTWYSQAGQDEFVYSIIGDSGFFVDVGAHDGIVHSNTYTLEQRGWTGFAVEPNAVAAGEFSRNRTTPVDIVVVSDHVGDLGFDGVKVVEGASLITCVTLRELLIGENAPSVIDYLSIDVEGHELEVLAGMDFERWHVRVATIEHNSYCDGPARKAAIAEIMTANGFDCYADDIVAPGYGEYESWWIHRDG